MSSTLRVGTSGWSYDPWVGPFYPDDLTSADRFGYYADRFDTVEINNTFYQLPDEATIRTWRDRAPVGFTYAVKASRYLTHMKKLNDPGEPLRTFLDRLRPLGPQLGPVLVQLPPNWNADVQRLESFLGQTPSDVRFAVEFRDPSWHDDEIYDALRRHGAALCIYDDAGTVTPKEVTADFVYLRFHGTEEGYRGAYGREGLAPWAGAVHAWLEAGTDVYAYFNNDADVSAPRDARTLRHMLES